MKVKCKHCEVAIEMPEQATIPTYVCKAHNVEPEHADVSAFDVRWERHNYHVPFGYQLVVVDEAVEVPEWAKTEYGLRDVINTAFPLWRDNEAQRYRASRWARVLYLGHRTRWTLRHIADELEMTLTSCEGCGFRCATHEFEALHAPVASFCHGSHTKQESDVAIVENIWRRAQRVATGSRADGTGRRVPRPKKARVQ